MSNKVQSLGTVSGSVTSGIAITGGTNATPIVATITAGHNLKSGDRIHISGVTGNTGMNGEWTLEFTSATTAKLLGSKGNGTYGGTPVANVICDRTPFLSGHSCMVHFQNGSTALSAGTFDVEGHDGTESSAGVLDTSKWKKATITDQNPDSPPFGTGSTYVGALPNINNSPVEVKLFKYMRVTSKTAITGTATAKLVA